MELDRDELGIRAGHLEVRLLEGGVLELRSSGFVTRRAQETAHARLQEILAREKGPLRYLSDARGIDGFEPGVPAAAVRWLMAHRDRFTRVALVARNTRVIAVGHAVHYLLPTLPYAVFTDRDEALRFLKAGSEAPPRRRRQTPAR